MFALPLQYNIMFVICQHNVDFCSLLRYIVSKMTLNVSFQKNGGQKCTLFQKANSKS